MNAKNKQKYYFKPRGYWPTHFAINKRTSQDGLVISCNHAKVYCVAQQRGLKIWERFGPDRAGGGEAAVPEGQNWIPILFGLAGRGLLEPVSWQLGLVPKLSN